MYYIYYADYTVDITHDYTDNTCLLTLICVNERKN